MTPKDQEILKDYHAYLAYRNGEEFDAGHKPLSRQDWALSTGRVQQPKTQLDLYVEDTVRESRMIVWFLALLVVGVVLVYAPGTDTLLILLGILWCAVGGYGFLKMVDYSGWGFAWLVIGPFVMVLGPLWLCIARDPKPDKAMR